MEFQELQKDKITDLHKQRLAKLEQDRRQILAMAPEKAVDAILDHSQNTALVHSMAEEDFFFLVHDIGAEDALDLLSLASNRQWEYILDLEIWNRDRIDINAVTYWLNLLHQADPRRMVRWGMNEKYDLLEYYLSRTVEVRVREHDEDPGDFGDGFFTYDSVFYVRFVEDAFSEIEDEEIREELQNFIYTMLERLADEDHGMYQIILLRAANVMPGESEEEAYRFRNVRLAEKGFLPFEEAVGVYASMKPETLMKRPRKIPLSAIDTDFNVPVPINHSSMLNSDTPFGKALRSIEAEDILNDIRIEFASLCNQVIAADQKPVKERRALRAIIDKACGYLGIGLQRLAGTDSPPDVHTSATLLNQYPLADIFRTGYGMVSDLRSRALEWQKTGWYARNNLALSFWGERLVGFIAGLMLKRPKYFDNYASGELYRDFAAMEDIRTAGSALDEAIAFDELFSLMGKEILDFPERRFITYDNLLLTVWARKRLGMDSRPQAIAVDDFRPLYRSLWSQEKPSHIDDQIKSDFLDWLSESTRIPAYEISEKSAEALEKLFASVEDEFARVDAADLDHRFITMFILKK